MAEILLPKHEFAKHIKAKELMVETILTVSGMLHTNKCTKEQASEKLLETGRTALLRFGMKVCIRAWNDLLLHSLLHVKGHKINGARLFYDPIMEYWAKFGGVIVKVTLEEELEKKEEKSDAATQEPPVVVE